MKRSPTTEFGVLPNDVERFTEGDCHFLARTLHQRTGWAMAAFKENNGPSLHAFVMSPDLRVLDVQGLCNVNDFKKRWDCYEIGLFDWRTLRANFCAPSFGHYTYERAHIIADRLLRLPEVAACL